MTLPSSIPDLPDRLQQRRDAEARQAAEAQAKAQSALDLASLTPLVIFKPFMEWWIKHNPGRSADGRGEADFHHFTPGRLPFNPAQWEWIDGELWYWTARNDRFCDLAYTYEDATPEIEGDSAGVIGQAPSKPWVKVSPRAWSGWLYQAQPEAFIAALPWRVKLWEDTELPANVPIRMPQAYQEGVRKRYGLQRPATLPGQVRSARGSIPAQPTAQPEAKPQAPPKTKAPGGGLAPPSLVPAADAGGGVGGLVLGAGLVFGAILLARR